MSEEIQIFNFPQDFSIEVFYKQLKFSMSQSDLILTPPSFPLFAWKLVPPPVFFISGDDGKLMYPDVQIRNLGDITWPPPHAPYPLGHQILLTCSTSWIFLLLSLGLGTQE